MAISASRTTVTSTATLLATNASSTTVVGDYTALSFVLKNLTGTASIFLGGGAAVTTGNGFEWAPGDGPISIDLEPGESLYAIVAAGTQTVHSLTQGR